MRANLNRFLLLAFNKLNWNIDLFSFLVSCPSYEPIVFLSTHIPLSVCEHLFTVRVLVCSVYEVGRLAGGRELC